MVQRKIQLIAGSTYSISLPKSWIEQNKLKPKEAINIIEQTDGSLSLTPGSDIQSVNSDKVILNAEEYGDEIDHALFVTYYLGVENIEIFSKKGIDSKTKDRITKVIGYMSGTEII